MPKQHLHIPAHLETEKDFQFKQKEWIFERIGWGLMALLIVAALAGLFSQGPLSKRKINDPEKKVEIAYERFQRYGAPSQMSIEILPSREAGTVVIFFGKGFMKNFSIETIQPQPNETSLTPKGWTMQFPASGFPSSIVMTIKPEARGTLVSEIGLEGHPPAKISIFSYP